MGDEAAINEIRSFVERIPGITSAQIRLVVALEDQSPADPNAPPDPTAGDDFYGADPSGAATDQFLNSDAGVTVRWSGDPKVTMSMKQPSNLTTGATDKLPRIPSATKR